MNAEVEKNLKRWLSGLRFEPGTLFLVGGAVRDLLMSRPVKDIDLACPDAAAVSAALARAGSATVVLFDKKADEPCYRIVNRQDPLDFIDMVPFRGPDLESDLRARDFTVNAMAMPILPGGDMGETIDPLEGRRDLADRRIRMVGPGVFLSDPLRILRGVRMASELGFSVDEKTLGRMKEDTPLVARIASERITAELFRILENENSLPYIRMMEALGILDVLFPEFQGGKNRSGLLPLEVLRSCETICKHPDRLFGPEAGSVRLHLESGRHRVLLKLAALWLDLSENACPSEQDGLGSRIDKALAEKLACRLKLSARDLRHIRNLFTESRSVYALSEPRRPRSRIMEWFRTYREEGISILLLGLAGAVSGCSMGDRIARRRAGRWAVCTIREFYRAIGPELDRRDLISGEDLLAMGIPSGPRMGGILRKIRAACEDGLIHTREEALDLAKKLDGHG